MVGRVVVRGLWFCFKTLCWVTIGGLQRMWVCRMLMEVVWFGLPGDDALEVSESCDVLRNCAWLASDLSANKG